MKASTVLSVVIYLLDEELIRFNYQSILQILEYKFIHSFSILSYDSSKASSKTIPPRSAI